MARRSRVTDRPVMLLASRRGGDVWLGDRHLYGAGEQRRSRSGPTALSAGAGSGAAAVADKRRVCLERRREKETAGAALDAPRPRL